jgi:hypothetical protein
MPAGRMRSYSSACLYAGMLYKNMPSMLGYMNVDIAKKRY